MRAIYNYYKKFSYPTTVMGASFRNVDQILNLAGCDCLTISPKLLDVLKGSTEPVAPALTVDSAKSSDVERVRYTASLTHFPILHDTAHPHTHTHTLSYYMRVRIRQL